MPVYLLGDEIQFPPAEYAEDGLLAVGGDLSAERLVRAYCEGIFPWYSDGQPILWHSPDPRFVLQTQKLHVPRSLRRSIRSQRFRVTMDQRFGDVIRACAGARRPDGDGTWITSEMNDAYTELHRRGLAHSVESWSGNELAGGLYGVSLGGVFFGESMFARRGDASKVAFVALVGQLDRWDIKLVDCQVHTDHLSRFGAEPWTRKRYLTALRRALKRPTRHGRWSFERDGAEALQLISGRPRSA